MIYDYVALDVETTGLSPAKDKVLEIGAAKVREGKVCAAYSALIDTGVPIPLKIQRLTGITDELQSTGRKAGQVFPEFLEFCGELPVLGHNVSFDFGFLKQGAVSLGLVFEKEALDTLAIARKVLPNIPSRTLPALCAHYGVDPGHSHRALSDALAAHEVLWKLWEEFKDTRPEAFSLKKLAYSAEKRSPITNSQKGYLIDLLKYHKIKSNIRMEDMTKSEASRLIDQIIFQHGRIPWQSRKDGWKV